MLYKTLTRPILTYGIECWLLSKKDGIMLQIFERRILRMIYGPVTIMVHGEQDTIVALYPLQRTRHSQSGQTKKTEVAGTPL